MIPIATIKAKKTAISFRFFILEAKESLAVMKERCSVVGLGSLPRADALSQCFARCKSLPLSNKLFFEVVTLPIYSPRQ